MKKRRVAESVRQDYVKWLHYFVDYGDRYILPATRSDQVRLFIQKLKEKVQTSEQQKQAAHAISLFFESQRQASHISSVQKKAALPIPSIPSAPLKQVPVRSAEQPAGNSPVITIP
jgi:hypothetical protein